MPEPQTGVAVGEMLVAVVLEHGHGELLACWLVLGAVLLLTPKKDEINPGKTRTPEAEAVGPIAVELVCGHGQDHVELDGEVELTKGVEVVKGHRAVGEAELVERDKLERVLVAFEGAAGCTKEVAGGHAAHETAGAGAVGPAEGWT